MHQVPQSSISVRTGFVRQVAFAPIAMTLCLLVVVGCQTQPTFIPGAGGSDFGTIAAPDGTNFKIIEQSDDTIRVEVDTADGLVFTIDPDGMLTGIENSDGTNIDLTKQSNGTFLVSGVAVFEGMQLPISFTIDPANPSARAKDLAAASGDPLIVCLIIDAFCENLEEIIAELLPPLVDVFIDANLPEIIQELGLKPILDLFLVDINDLSFPTGFSQIDDPIRAEANRRIEPMLVEVRNFCAHWQLLRLLEISVCDDAGS
ncbi:MAG: hypothetical protein H6819_05515 [Phycisphaerales bacterium]|nr:hypothetical protein [Phycisphaerales bacterium]MCB9854762.1 hypothetical protein [Phycisphaerales bacterium]MCB9863766.1 hypothetical protein [Phycisphaerales bacterium]